MAVYVINLFDEEYLRYINNITFFKLDIYYGEPRNFGATVSCRFD